MGKEGWEHEYVDKDGVEERKIKESGGKVCM
jgi:hypothetical protein